MRQKGIKNMNNNDRSGPQGSNTTQSVKMNEHRKSGNLALPGPKNHSFIKRAYAFRFKNFQVLIYAGAITFLSFTRKSGHEQ